MSTSSAAHAYPNKQPGPAGERHDWHRIIVKRWPRIQCSKCQQFGATGKRWRGDGCSGRGTRRVRREIAALEDR